MNCEATRSPDIALYVGLIDDFADGTASASEFARSFIGAVKSERRTLGDPVYAILQELFEDADAHVECPELRTEPEDLNDDRLLSSALRTRRSLRRIGY